MADKRNRFIGTMEDIEFLAPCATCKHKFSGTPSCSAFSPNDIPAFILSGENDHRRPVIGDHNIQWEKNDRISG